MQIAASRLSEHVSKGLRSVYALHGDEPLLQQEAADVIRQTAREQGYTERQMFMVAGAHFDWAEVQAAAGAMSLFADKLLIDLRIPSGKPGKEGSVALQSLTEQLADQHDVLLLVSLPRLDKTAKSSGWFMALENHGATVQLDPIDRSGLPTWIAHRLGQQQQRVREGEEGQRSLQFFADRVEGNLLAAHQEIQKLGLLYPPGELDFEQIERAVLNVARYDVFKLTEAVLAGQHLRVQRMVDGLQAEGVSEVLVHYTLAEDIRSLKRVKDAVMAGRPLPQVLREQRVWGLKERLFERVLPQLKPAQLERLLHSAHQVDGVVKGMKLPTWPSDSWQALLRLALMFSKACSPR
ncbi:MAG: DNA polymerase III subunit delta [Betaproteobacteria bacterium]|nr:DNA polymerase III subunit delta [Betaproteobacteria bacterium]